MWIWKASGLKNDSDDLSLCEHFVRVDWIKTVKEKEAYWEKNDAPIKTVHNGSIWPSS